MRLWSIHPKYLDSRGLVALWRETLLAKKVLLNQTAGYKNHPQLQRFRGIKDPIGAIKGYQTEIYQEARKRDFNFDREKFDVYIFRDKIAVTRGQLLFEWEHFKKKLNERAPEKLAQLESIEPGEILPHPLFFLIDGPIEPWEKT